MKKKIAILTGIIILLRIVNIIYLHDDPLFYLSPRNLNGRGILVMPNIVDFVIPLLVILFFLRKESYESFHLRKIYKPLSVGGLLILTPLVTGCLLRNYIQQSWVTIAFNKTLLLRYLLFVLTFMAVNVFADNIPFTKKSLRIFILVAGIIALAYTQEIFGSAGEMFTLLALVNSVGLSTVFFTIGLRKYYKEAPLESMVAVSVSGIFLIFLVYNVLSVSYFTIFLPFVATLLVAISIYKPWKLKTKVIVASFPFLLALFLNIGLPRMVSPTLAGELVERRPEEDLYTVKYDGITVKFTEEKMRAIALRFAKVIDRANKISDRKLGVSPQVKELVITGIGPGGFHAEFPDRIVGKIISEKYLEQCEDSAFLNDPALSPDFPDPVNAILHEYSHLFGAIPYFKWCPGAEEEGWATYSATRLATLLYEEDNHLWQPAYDFGKQADKITRLNLSERAVAWSHPNEFGGFILWYRLGERLGVPELYRQRWETTARDLNGSLYFLSDPAAARKVIDLFGKESFLKFGSHPKKTFKTIYHESVYLYLAKTTGMDTGRMMRMYNFMKNKIVDPSVPLP